MSDPVILALDPGLSCGYALVRGDEVLESGVWDCEPASLALHPGIFPQFVDDLLYDLQRRHTVPHVIAMERPAGVRGLTTVRNHYVFQIVTQLRAAQWDIDWIGVHPSTLKKWATGSGKANKALMCYHAGTTWGMTAEQIAVLDDNEADALLIAAWAQERMKSERSHSTITEEDSDD